MPELAEAKQKSHATWESMAPGWRKYDDFIWSMSRHIGEAIVRGADPQPGQTVLDIACGPGDTGFKAAMRVGDSGKLIATDFSQGMVDVARDRAESLGINNGEFRTMDAENMDLADSSVDAIVCRWGFMLMTDPQAALKECHRVLKPGGRLSYSVWGAAERNAWVTLYGKVMKEQGYPPTGDPFGPGGMFSMADEKTIRSMMDEAGFADVSVEEMEVHWRHDDFDDLWSFATEVAGAVAALVKQLPPDKVAEFRDALGPATEPFKTEAGGYDFPGMTMNVAGRKP